MTIELNGEVTAIEEETLLAALLQRLGVRSGRVAVEINQRVVPKAEYGLTVLRACDKVEIVNFVGGG
jgi:sulfur carrier protein